MEEEVIIFSLLFATIFGLYFLRSRENLAMIEKGMNPRRSINNGPRPYTYMKYALLCVGGGIGLFLAYMIDVSYLHDITRVKHPDGTTYYRSNEEIYFALLAIGGGIGLFSAYRLERRHMADKKKEIDNEV